MPASGFSFILPRLTIIIHILHHNTKFTLILLLLTSTDYPTEVMKHIKWVTVSPLSAANKHLKCKKGSALINIHKQTIPSPILNQYQQCTVSVLFSVLIQSSFIGVTSSAYVNTWWMPYTFSSMLASCTSLTAYSGTTWKTVIFSLIAHGLGVPVFHCPLSIFWPALPSERGPTFFRRQFRGVPPVVFVFLYVVHINLFPPHTAISGINGS